MKGAGDENSERISVQNSESLNLRKVAAGFVILSISLFLLALITHFALSLSLRNDYPEIALKLNKDSIAVTNQLSSFVSEKIASKRNSNLPEHAGQVEQKQLQTAPGLNGVVTDNDISNKLISHATNVLINDPLNGELYRLLGQLNEFEGNQSSAYKLMSAASDISSREIIAHDLNLRLNLKNNRPKAALVYADRLFSFAPELVVHYIPAFNFFLQNDVPREGLARRLSRNPYWRVNFMSQVVPRLSDNHNNILSLFSSLNKTSFPVNNKELNYYITSLISAGKYDIAYQTWRSFLLPDRLEKLSLINNGSFEEDPTGLPFDWTIAGGKEARAQLNDIRGDNNARALNVELGNGRIIFPNISQLIVLAPGNYRIDGRYTGEAIGKRGLFWSVYCLGGNKLGSSEQILGRFSNWRDFHFEFNVPDSNCRAQRIFLHHGARSPSEQILSGSIYFDDIRATALQVR